MTKLSDNQTSFHSNPHQAQSSVISVVCRICYDNDKEEDLITPCNCKGTVAFVHRTCLETWLGESNTARCELCHQPFKTHRRPKYTSAKSIWVFCRRSPVGFSRGVKSDILACAIITPLAIVITYVCLFSSEYYSQKKFVNVPAARWTSISLLIMIGIMLVGYYMWVYSVIRMHARLWYNWWQRTCDVTYIPSSAVDVSINENPVVNETASLERAAESGSSQQASGINSQLIFPPVSNITNSTTSGDSDDNIV